MFLSVLKNGLETMSHYVRLLNLRTQQDKQYLFKLLYILTTNRIKYEVYDGMNF
jgi:hypothetical protein